MGDMLELFKGDTRIVIVSVLDSASAMVDISSASDITFKVGALPNGPALVVKDMLSNGGVAILTPDSGFDFPWEFSVEFDEDDLNALDDSRIADYYYEGRLHLVIGDALETVITGILRLRNTMV
jgi:hypothetical protein